jgi:hypothetical protein
MGTKRHRTANERHLNARERGLDVRRRHLAWKACFHPATDAAGAAKAVRYFTISACFVPSSRGNWASRYALPCDWMAIWFGASP